MLFKHRYNIRPYVIALIIFLSFIFVDMRIRPLIKTMAASQAKLYCTRAINNAIAESLTDGTYTHENLVSIIYSEKGEVTSVSINTSEINRIKSILTNNASKEIEELSEQKMSIPIGTLIGTPFFSGRGPRIVFKLIPSGTVQSSLHHKFDEAAINQTRHQIILEINARVAAILPGFSAYTEISCDVTLAETVIVGEIPQSFTQVITDSNCDMADTIANYGP